MSRFFAVCFGIAFFLVPFGGFAQLKIGVVDSELILQQLEEAKKADQILKQLEQKYRDSLQKIEQQYIAELQKYEKQKGMMNEQARQQAEQRIVALREQYLLFQQEKFGVTGEIAQKQQELLQPIREKVLKAIEEVAKEEKINFVFDKAAPSLLYFENRFNITYKVLDRLQTKD